MSDDVTLDVTDGVATVTLDNPEQMNALSAGVVVGVERALGEVAEHDEARCVVVEGAGDAFCAGGDISGMGGGDVSGYERAEAVTESATRVAYGLYDCDLPTVATVDGYCVGAGMGVALSCDVVLASEDATFGLAFRNVGLTLDYGTSYFVTQAVGPYKAKELALTAEMLSGEEAADLGLANHAYAPGKFDDKADAFVETVAEGPTVALEFSLTNIDRAARRTVREAIEAESRAQSFATQTRDHEEGVAAFSEDREPGFEGR